MGSGGFGPRGPGHAGTPHLPNHQPTREPPLPPPVAHSPVAVGAWAFPDPKRSKGLEAIANPDYGVHVPRYVPSASQSPHARLLLRWGLRPYNLLVTLYADHSPSATPADVHQTLPRFQIDS